MDSSRHEDQSKKVTSKEVTSKVTSKKVTSNKVNNNEVSRSRQMTVPEPQALPETKGTFIEHGSTPVLSVSGGMVRDC
jgi:hypothetical protein